MARELYALELRCLTNGRCRFSVRKPIKVRRGAWSGDWDRADLVGLLAELLRCLATGIVDSDREYQQDGSCPY
jgi:hypothetical protein